MIEKARIQILEPYYSGSHAYWADNLQKHLDFDVDINSLSGRHWKWRMSAGAISLANQCHDYPKPDLFLASDMLDLASFKGLLDKKLQNVPTALYMHENQLVYPSQHQEDYDRQYPLFNFKSMIAADRIFFNSQFHLDALFDALPKFLKAFPDKRNIDLLSGLKEKSQVLSLGIDPPMPDIQTRNDIPVILWNHRWEHDKHPDLFFKSLITCSELGLKFRLIVCGEHFDQTPDIFKRAKDILAQHIIHWGFAETREVYQTLLAQSDLLPVTSHQEYFGLSVMEAAAYGVDLLLPNRLVYPELYKGSAAQFYDSDRAFEQLLQASIQSPRFSKIDVSQYYWKEVVKDYEQAFRALIKS